MENRIVVDGAGSGQRNMVGRIRPLLMGYALAPTSLEAGEWSLIHGVRLVFNISKPSVLHTM